MLKFVPGGPELVSTTVAGASTTRINVCVASLWFTNVTFGAVICTVWLLEPSTLYCATSVAPVQVILALVQLNALLLDRDTVALLHVPGPKVMVPRSRFCSIARISGLITFADTGATWVPACAGCC